MSPRGREARGPGRPLGGPREAPGGPARGFREAPGRPREVPGGPGRPQGPSPKNSIFQIFFDKIGIFDHFDHILACFDLKIGFSMKNYPRGLVQSFWGAPGLPAPGHPPGPQGYGIYVLMI